MTTEEANKPRSSRQVFRRLKPDKATILVILGMLFLGVTLYLFQDDRDQDQFVIQVTSAEREHLADQWLFQFGTEPTQDELDTLIAEWTIEEAMVREARRMGLDENDTIIRSRLRQKLEFLTSDQGETQPIAEIEIRAFFLEHRDLYEIPETINFRHVFFSGEKRENPRQDAEAALQSIDDDNWESFGDPFHLSSSYTDTSYIEIRREMGYRFETAILNATDGEWHGPVTSWYGIHLIHVGQRTPSRPAEYESVREQVKRDLQLQRNDDAQTNYIDEIVAKYRVEIAL